MSCSESKSINQKAPFSLMGHWVMCMPCLDGEAQPNQLLNPNQELNTLCMMLSIR